MRRKKIIYIRKAPFTINHFLFPFFIWLFTVSFSAESNDDVLFTVQGREVSKSEFLYFFHKNCNDSIEQNIDLCLEQFIDMHLKLAQARQKHLDRNFELNNELTNFRIQLAKPYLTDNRKEEELAREAYERIKFEVNASHILIKINDNDTLSAYNKAIQARNKILSGEPFESVARDYSDDPNIKFNSGNLGYFSAFQSEYNFEKIVFEMNPGDLSMPAKSSMGYHIIQCRDKRKNQDFEDKLPSFEEMKSKLIEWIKKPSDPRSEIIQESFTGKLKKEWNFEENKATPQILQSLGKRTFYNGFEAPKDVDQYQVLCKIDGKKLTLADLYNYISDYDTISSRIPVKIKFQSYYKKFISNRLITYENFKLEDKYPEFRYQLWEYRDAMLLLKITEQQVWQKSVSDTLGLKKFYLSKIDENSETLNNRDSFHASQIPDEILSDYQSFLMKSWIEKLHSKYKIKVDKKVLSSVKKFLKLTGNNNLPDKET